MDRALLAATTLVCSRSLTASAAAVEESPHKALLVKIRCFRSALASQLAAPVQQAISGLFTALVLRNHRPKRPSYCLALLVASWKDLRIREEYPSWSWVLFRSPVFQQLWRQLAVDRLFTRSPVALPVFV